MNDREGFAVRRKGPMLLFLCVLIVLIPAGLGCGEDSTQPPLDTSSGLILRLPETEFEWVRIELWHENEVEPPRCRPEPPLETERALLMPLGLEPGQGLCDRWTVEIWNLIGERVRLEPEIPFPGSAWAWNQKDDNGSLVPSGVYFTHQECVESDQLQFDGSYYVWADREQGSCEWPVWIEEVNPAAGAELRYENIPTIAQTQTLDYWGNPETVVVFQSPFVLRVHAPGQVPFQQEISFREGFFTTVNVELIPEQ